MYRLDFTLPGLPRLQTNNYANNFARSKDKREWEERVRAIVLGDHYLPDLPLSRAELRFERHSTTEPDFDNLVASFKPICDGLTKCGVIQDDKPSVIGSPNFKWFKAKRGEGHVRVIVEECE